MNRNVFLVFLLFALLLVPNALALKAKVLEYDPFPAKAGAFVDIFIAVENNTSGETEPVVVTFIPKDSIRLSYGEEATKDIGTIPRGKSIVVKYRAEIVSDAVDGENFFEFDAEMGKAPTESFDLGIEVDNSVPTIEIGDVESVPSKILPDMRSVQLTVTLLNTGEETAENLRAELVLPEAIEASDSFSDKALLGNLAESSSADAVFEIDVPEETESGEYLAIVEVKYNLTGTGKKTTVKKELDFKIDVKEVPKFEIVKVETNPSELSAGDRGVKMLVEVKNVGTADAEFVRIKVFEKSEQPFEFDKVSDFIAPKLRPGETGQATLEFRVTDDADLQKYLLEAEVKTLVDDTIRLEQKVIELNVKEGMQEYPDPLLLIGGAVLVVAVVGFAYWRMRCAIRDKKGK